jgi:hypothetical protein
MLAAAASARADSPIPALPWLEGGVRAGIAGVEYTSNQFDTEDGMNLNGLGYWIDGELGFRHGSWTFGATASYLYHHDIGSADTPCGPSTWNIRLYMYEVGARATWHLDKVSLGAGVIPVVGARLDGNQSIQLTPLNGTGTYVLSALRPEHMSAAEVHGGYDVATIGGHYAVQLFALVEVGTPLSSGPTDAGSMLNVRLGVGATF